MINLPDLPTKAPVDQPTAPQVSSPPGRFSAIPENYKFIKERAARESTDYIQPPTGSRMAAMPTFLGGGQYSQVPTQPEKLLKSKAVYDPEFNTALAGGPLFRSRVEIDHNIPLWLGGTDTPDNKVAIPKAEHEKKTKAQAVIMTLYYAQKMGLQEAKTQAINWQGKNVNNIVLDENGQMDLANAEKIYEDWKKPTEISAGDVLKTWGKKLGSAITLGKYKGEPSPTDRGEQLYARALEEGPKNILGQFAQGVASGVTLGAVPSEGVKEEPFSQTAARGTGKLVGTLASFAWLGKLIGLAGKATLGTRTVGGKTVSELPAWMKRLENTDAIFRAGKVVLPKNTALKMIKNAGLFTLHGQLSKQDQNTFEKRTKRFFSDAAFGGLLAVPGQTLKGYSGLAAGTYALSALEGADPGSALFNTALVVGLHGVGGVGYDTRIQSLANKASIKERAKWGIKAPKSGEKVTAERIEAENKMAIEKVWEKAESPEDAARMIENIVISGRQLYKSGLGREQRLLEDIKDTKSIVQRTNKLTESQLDKTPENISSFFTALESGIPIRAEAQQKPVPFNREVFSSTGVSGKVNTRTQKNIIEYVGGGGKVGDNVVIGLVTDPKRIEIYKKINSKKPADKRFDPEAVIEVHGKVGGREYDLGRIPTEKRLTDPEFGIIDTYRSWGLSENKIPKASSNNVNLANWLKERGIDTVAGKITHLSKRSPGSAERKGSLQPAVSFEITGQDFLNAPSIKGMIGKRSAEKISESISVKPEAVIKTAISGKEKGTILNTITQKYPESDNFAILVDGFRKTIKGKTPEQLKKILNEDYGVIADINKTKQVIDRANEMTVRDYLNFLYENNIAGRLNENGKSIFDLIFSKDSFYYNLSNEAKRDINKMKLMVEGPSPIDYKKTGQIKQEIKLEEPVRKESFAKKGEQTKIEEYIEPTIEAETIKYTEPIKMPEKKIAEKKPEKIKEPEFKQADVIKSISEIKKLEKKTIKSTEISGKKGTINIKDIRAGFEDAKKSGNKKLIGKYVNLLDKIGKAPTIPVKKTIKAIHVPSIKVIQDRITSAESSGNKDLVAGYKKLLESVEKASKKSPKTQKTMSKDLQRQLDDLDYERNISTSKITAEDILRPEMEGTKTGSLGELERELTPKTLFKEATDNKVILKQKDGTYEYEGKTLGKNADDALDYMKNNMEIYHKINTDVVKRISGWRYPESSTGEYKIMNTFDKTIDSLKKKEPKEQWEKVLNNKKIKWWTELIKTVEAKDKKFREKSISMKKLKDFWQSETLGSKDMEKLLNIDYLTWKIEKFIKNKQYDNLPDGIKKIVDKEMKKNKNIKFIVGSTKEYRGFYNLTNDIRKFVTGTEKKRDLARSSLTDKEKKSLPKTIGISEENIAEYMSNLGSANIQMPIVHNMLYKAFGPTENLHQLTNKQIKSSADNAANMISSMIKFKEKY